MTILRRRLSDLDGIVLVHIPASVDAPHRAPDKRFYGRSDRTSYPLSTAELERLIAGRRQSENKILADLAEFVTHKGDWRRVDGARLAIVTSPSPTPANDQILMRLMSDRYREWLDGLCERSGLIGQGIVGSRTATGVSGWRSVQRYAGEQSTQLVEVDRDGSIRYTNNDISYRVGAEQTMELRTLLRWRQVIEHVARLVRFSNEIWDQVGAQYGLRIALELRGIFGLYPERFYFDNMSDRKRAAEHGGFEEVPFRGQTYVRVAELDALSTRGNLIDLHHKLFSPLLNSMGVPPVPEHGQLLD